MNWLAHALLSEPDVEFRLGNLLADLVKGRDRDGMSANFLRGVKCHQAIDSFTDSHPIVHRSRARIGAGYRHVTGILVDVFSDHFLALDWERYSANHWMRSPPACTPTSGRTRSSCPKRRGPRSTA